MDISKLSLSEAYLLGRRKGHEEAIEELCKLLRIEELIAKAIKSHGERFHDE